MWPIGVGIFGMIGTGLSSAANWAKLNELISYDRSQAQL